MLFESLLIHSINVFAIYWNIILWFNFCQCYDHTLADSDFPPAKCQTAHRPCAGLFILSFYICFNQQVSVFTLSFQLFVEPFFPRAKSRVSLERLHKNPGSNLLYICNQMIVRYDGWWVCSTDVKSEIPALLVTAGPEQTDTTDKTDPKHFSLYLM